MSKEDCLNIFTHQPHVVEWLEKLPNHEGEIILSTYKSQWPEHSFKRFTHAEEKEMNRQYHAMSRAMKKTVAISSLIEVMLDTAYARADPATKYPAYEFEGPRGHDLKTIDQRPKGYFTVIRKVSEEMLHLTEMGGMPVYPLVRSIRDGLDFIQQNMDFIQEDLNKSGDEVIAWLNPQHVAFYRKALAEIDTQHRIIDSALKKLPVVNTQAVFAGPAETAAASASPRNGQNVLDLTQRITERNKDEGIT